MWFESLLVFVLLKNKKKKKKKNIPTFPEFGLYEISLNLFVRKGNDQIWVQFYIIKDIIPVENKRRRRNILFQKHGSNFIVC